MLDELIRLLREADSYAAVQHLQGASGEGALEVAERFDAAVRGLYWEHKDVSAVVTVARAGILYCLAKSAEAGTQEIADQLAGKAKALAANMGSFTWPGWAEPGCSPSRADMEAGLDAARLNLRLAEELGRPPERIEDAHWLLGAQLIAAGEPELALEEFLLSNSESRPLFHGYTLAHPGTPGPAGRERKSSTRCWPGSGRREMRPPGSAPISSRPRTRCSSAERSRYAPRAVSRSGCGA
jgi:hypothetical protein